MQERDLDPFHMPNHILDSLGQLTKVDAPIYEQERGFDSEDNRKRTGFLKDPNKDFKLGDMVVAICFSVSNHPYRVRGKVIEIVKEKRAWPTGKLRHPINYIYPYLRIRFLEDCEELLIRKNEDRWFSEENLGKV